MSQDRDQIDREDNESLEMDVDGDGDTDGEAGNEGGIDGPTWEVKAVKGIRFKQNRIEFSVVWQTDNSMTWEPKESFPDELENEMIQDYKMKNPEKWERVMKKMNQSNNRWCYVLQSDEDRYEKPDASAKREARMLADPNRLEDPDEKFLKTYGIGIEGRASRSKTRVIKQTINMSSAESSVSSQRATSPKEVTEKKKRGRKKKEDQDEPSTSSRKKSPAVKKQTVGKRVNEEFSTANTERKKKKKVEDIKNEKAEEKKEDEKKETTRPMQKSGNDSWKKKKREQKLNSSDSSEDEDGSMLDEQSAYTPAVTLPGSTYSKRIEGGANSPSVSPAVETSSSVKTGNKKMRKKKMVFDDDDEDDDRQEKQTQQNDRKRSVIPVDTSIDIQSAYQFPTKDPRVVYVDDESQRDLDIENAFSDFGMKITKGNPGNRLLNDYNRRKAMCPRVATVPLERAILQLDPVVTELCLINMGPKKALEEIQKSRSFHEIMIATYEQINRGAASEEIIDERRRKTEKLIRAALPYLPISILIDQEENTLNTLLHCAINTESPSLVEFLIKMGSPLHIRNIHEMTAFEACLVMRNATLLDIVIKNGGTFHHVIERRRLDGLDHERLFVYLQKPIFAQHKYLLGIVDQMKMQIQTACDKVRRQQISNRLTEFESGPIVSFPRGNVRWHGGQQTVQFMIPDKWVDDRNAKFMLVVMPMAYNSTKKYFLGSSQKAPLKSVELCGTKCESMTTRKGIFYRATAALQRHFATVKRAVTTENFYEIANYKELKEREESVKKRISRPLNSKICSITLDFDSSAFSFVTCQLIRYVPNKTVPRSLTRPQSAGSSSSQGNVRPASSHQRPGPTHYRPESTSFRSGINNPSNSHGRRGHQYTHQRYSNGAGPSYSKPYNRP